MYAAPLQQAYKPDVVTVYGLPIFNLADDVVVQWLIGDQDRAAGGGGGAFPGGPGSHSIQEKLQRKQCQG